MHQIVKTHKDNLIYYKTKINNESEWIWWTGHSTSTHTAANSVLTHATATGSDAFGRPSAPITTSLANGADGRLITN